MHGVPIQLNNKVALITGGSRGIGAETVRLFAQAGARVVFSYQKAKDKAEALVAECGGASAEGARCTAIQQELATPADGEALVAAAIAAYGRLDALIVNHAIWTAPDTRIDTMTDAQWRQTMSINLDSVFGLVRAATRQMLSQPLLPGHENTDNIARRGHIVLISSSAGQRGDGFHADYAATKGAIISLTKSLSTELAPLGILANCVAPGWVDTEMTNSVFGQTDSYEKVASGIPLGRPGRAAEIAGPILFLCSPFANFISGEIFNVNGGAVLVG
jgi:3-oxoacyl-[acyl-carrier protein] reductase